LYPFTQTIERPNCTLEKAIENIDIGGPTMIRAAAKNHSATAVVVDETGYQIVGQEMQLHNGAVTAESRLQLAIRAFTHTAFYEDAIANYIGALSSNGERLEFPLSYNLQVMKKQDMRYGENPHQRAAFYVEHRLPPGSIACARQHQGKPLSFNNIADTDAALECVKTISDHPACVIVKHANPCGVAIGNSLLEAYDKAYQTDPVSAFGGIIACNRKLDAATAKAIIDRQFVEVVVAPEIEHEALKILATKPNVRALSVGQWPTNEAAYLDFKRVRGGILVQDLDQATVQRDRLRRVTKRAPDDSEMEDLLLAWKIAKFVKSNAIVYTRGGQTIGIGAGQMSRVYSARIAAVKAQDANLSLSGSVMASDAFFPFRDAVDAAAEHGISAIIQPGGSRRDEEVIKAADEHDMAMVFTGIRHFRH